MTLLLSLVLSGPETHFPGLSLAWLRASWQPAFPGHLLSLSQWMLDAQQYVFPPARDSLVGCVTPGLQPLWAPGVSGQRRRC